MVYFRDRRLAYKVGFGGLVAGILGYIAAFACPFWALLRLEQYGYADQTVGLWQACLHGSLTCVSNIHGNNPAWINAARALCCIALIIFFIVLFLGWYRNISRTGQANCNTPGRYLEILAVLAVLLGSIGVIVFAAEFHRIYMYEWDVGHLAWAFGLVCSSLAVAGVSSLVMFARHSPKPSSRRGHRHLQQRVATLRGQPVRIHFSTASHSTSAAAAALEDGSTLHIPYFGDVTPGQLVYGAAPVLPPSYEMVTGGIGFPFAPPVDGQDAPPLYEEVTKDASSSLPPEMSPGSGGGDSRNDDGDGDGGGGGGCPGEAENKDARGSYK